MVWKLLSSHTFLWFSAQCLDGCLRISTSPFLFVFILVSPPSLVWRTATSATWRCYSRNCEHGEKCHRQIGERLPVEDSTTVKRVLEDTDNIVGDITGEGLVTTLNCNLWTVGLPLGVVFRKGWPKLSVSSMWGKLLLPPWKLLDRRACLLRRHYHWLLVQSLPCLLYPWCRQVTPCSKVGSFIRILLADKSITPYHFSYLLFSLYWELGIPHRDYIGQLASPCEWWFIQSTLSWIAPNSS